MSEERRHAGLLTGIGCMSVSVVTGKEMFAMALATEIVRKLVGTVVSGSWGARLLVLAGLVGAIVILDGGGHVEASALVRMVLVLAMLVVIFRLLLGGGRR